MKNKIFFPGRFGFTLIEVMVVVVIIGILAGVSAVSYRNTREKALDREAVAALRLIRAGERQYYARMERFWPAGSNITNIAHINGNLSIDLRTGVWNYSVQSNSGGSTFSSNARRLSRTWTITSANSNPACTGSCV
ncbi:MAG: prepilin-type N-terminal cleavage/methylation domain-containing protein [Candidatus Omnitrophota bacterium]